VQRASGIPPRVEEHDSERGKLRWLVLVAVFCGLWFALIEQRTLWDPDEARYAEIPREMVASGDWVTPRLNDLLYFEKPPLQYWATALAFELFGQHNWSARLWSALTGLAGVLFAFYTGRRLYSSRVGLYAAIMLASSLLYFALAHLNTLDMGLAFFTEVVIFALALGLRGEPRSADAKIWIAVAWIAAALAVLSKGLIGIVLPVGALICYSLLCRTGSIWKKLSPGMGGVLFLLVTTPWFVAVSRANPDFAQFFFVHEHFTRFTTTEHHRGQPWWFFLPVLALGALPWTAPMACGLWRAFRSRVHSAFDPARFFAIWAVVVFVFFSASGSKLMPYILPVFPALALLGARYLNETPSAVVARQLFWSGIVPALLLCFAPYAVELYANAPAREIAQELKTGCMLAAALWIAGAALAAWAAKKGKVETALIAMALLVIAAHQIALYAAEEVVGPTRSSLMLSQQIKPHLGEATRVYTVGIYPQSLPVYLGRTVTLVNVRGELDFGLNREPAKGIPTMEAFLEKWAGERDAIAVMRKETYSDLARQGVAMRLIAEDPVQVAVQRP
jgi:4-amino-4-deoxy-L-arabinose transferase-like glycosyltransferase